MIVDSRISLDLDELKPREWDRLFKRLTFINAKREIVTVYRRYPSKVEIPRGAWNLLPNRVRYLDRRVSPSAPKVAFTLDLDDLEADERFEGQREAVEAALSFCLVRPCMSVCAGGSQDAAP
jgi:hypothetical protein